MIYLILSIFVAVPIFAVLFFGISLYDYCSARRKNKKQPGSYDAEAMKKRKLQLIISSVIAGVLLAVVVTFVILIYTAVAFM